jgi:hypothetical protein
LQAGAFKLSKNDSLGGLAQAAAGLFNELRAAWSDRRSYVLNLADWLALFQLKTWPAN